MRSEDVIAGFTRCNGGEHITVRFFFKNDVDTELKWHGVVVAPVKNPAGVLIGAKVKFFPGQAGLPQDGRYHTFTLPHRDVGYYNITLDDNENDSDSDVSHMASEHARLATASTLSATDPTTWIAYFGGNQHSVLLLIEKLAREFGVSGRSSHRLRANFECLEGHILLIADMEDPFASPHVKLQCQRLVNLVRDQVNAEKHVDIERLRGLAKGEANKDDPYAVAEAKMQAQTDRTRKGAERLRWRKANWTCDKCGKTGHTAAYCRNPEGKPSGNGKGGNAKRE